MDYLRAFRVFGATNTPPSMVPEQFLGGVGDDSAVPGGVPGMAPTNAVPGGVPECPH